MTDLPDLPKKAGRPVGKEEIPLETMLAMAQEGLKPIEIAERLGVARQTVSIRLRNFAKRITRLEEFKLHKADVMAEIQMEILHSINASDIKKAPLQIKAMTYGIFYDKERLERGQSTSNVSIKSVVDDLEKRKQALLSQKQALIKP